MRSRRRLRPLLAIVIATVAAVAVPLRASASTQTVVLHWTAPAGCPSADEVTARVRELAGPLGTLEADVSVAAMADRFEALLRVRSAGLVVGERLLGGDSCAELAESIAVVLAMSSTLSVPEAPLADPSPPTPLSLPVVPAPEESPSKQVTSPAPPAREALLRIAPVAALDVGTLPKAVAGGALALSAAPGRGVALGLTAALFVETHSYAPNTTPPQGASFSLVSANATGCYVVLRRPIELSPCLLIELQRLSATGLNADSVRNARADRIAFGGGIQSRVELPRALAVRLEVDGAVSSQPERFLITGLGTVYTTTPFALRASLGPELRF